jgi:hypothetical protein
MIIRMDKLSLKILLYKKLSRQVKIFLSKVLLNLNEKLT